MKTKKINSKLNLNKTTITVLGENQQVAVNGGYYRTIVNDSCYTWTPVCPTRPEWYCPYTTKCVTIQTE